MSSKPKDDNILETDLQIENDENQPEIAFDEQAKSQIEEIKKLLDPSWDVVIIVKTPDKEPIVYGQGHPYDTTALGVQFVREMKSRLIPDLEC